MVLHGPQLRTPDGNSKTHRSDSEPRAWLAAAAPLPPPLHHLRCMHHACLCATPPRAACAAPASWIASPTHNGASYQPRPAVLFLLTLTLTLTLSHTSCATLPAPRLSLRDASMAPGRDARPSPPSRIAPFPRTQPPRRTILICTTDATALTLCSRACRLTPCSCRQAFPPSSYCTIISSAQPEDARLPRAPAQVQEA